MTVATVGGWQAVFAATSSGSDTNVGNCSFSAMEGDEGDPIFTLLVCNVDFTPAESTFTLKKRWIESNVNFEGLGNILYTLEIACDNSEGGIDSAITTNGSAIGTSSFCADDDDADPIVANCDFITWDFNGTDPEEVTVTVKTPTQCRGFETEIGDNSAVVSSGCSSYIDVDFDENKSCTITNTTFFEGIPTLNQYGMAILALLMLGVGFVGFRRFV